MTPSQAPTETSYEWGGSNPTRRIYLENGVWHIKAGRAHATASSTLELTPPSQVTWNVLDDGSGERRSRVASISCDGVNLPPPSLFPTAAPSEEPSEEPTSQPTTPLFFLGEQTEQPKLVSFLICHCRPRRRSSVGGAG